MLSKLALFAAVAAAASSSSSSSTTNPLAIPTSVQFIGFPSRTNCTGASYTQTAMQGVCLKLKQPAESFMVHPQPQQAHMELYGSTDCSGKGGYLHTDQGDGACVTPDGYFQPPPAPSTLGSVCYEC